MLLIELTDRARHSLYLEFHPLLTVVPDLSERQRGDLATAIRRTLQAENAGLELRVDLGGTPRGLSSGLLTVLGWAGVPLGNVIGQGDVDRAAHVPAVPEPGASRVDPTAIVAARADLAQAEVLAGSLGRRLQAALEGETLGSDDEERVRQALAEARIRVAERRTALDAESGQGEDAEAPEDKLERLTRLRGMIENRIRELQRIITGVDPVELLPDDVDGTQTHFSLQRELAVAILDLHNVKVETLAVEQSSLVESTEAVNEQFVSRLRAELAEAEEAERRLAAEFDELQAQSNEGIAQGKDLVEQLAAAHGKAVASARAIAQRVEYFTRLAPETGMLRSKVEEIELAVLARAANLRGGGFGESVPIIVDAAFDHLAPEMEIQLLEVLARVSPAVQVIYLSSTPVAGWWAGSKDLSAAAVCHLKRS